MSDQCMICGEKATQEHHLLYEPEEITILICVPCHLKLHNHGVGVGSGASRGLRLNPNKPLPPTFTYVEDSIVKLINNDEELDELNCINGCGRHWRFFTEASTDRFLIRCSTCGWDTEVKRVG